MGCKLDKYTNYEVSKVTKDGNRIIVTLKDPPDSCPDGVLNNSHTFIQKDSSVSVPTLSFSTKRNAPVVLMPPGASTTQRVDPVDIPKAESHWFLITLGSDSDSNNDTSSDYGSDSDPYVADSSSSDDSYSSNSDDSYSSDSGSSYDSDSGSSYSSDSGSDYGSDSGGGWDSGGGIDGGSFGSDS